MDFVYLVYSVYLVCLVTRQESCGMMWQTGCSNWLSCKAAASETLRRTLAVR
jgi:hypothetical protein